MPNNYETQYERKRQNTKYQTIVLANNKKYETHQMFETHCYRKHNIEIKHLGLRNSSCANQPRSISLICFLALETLVSLLFLSHSSLSSCLMLLHFMNVMTFLHLIRCASGENCCPSQRFLWIQCATDSRSVRLHSSTLSLFAPPHIIGYFWPVRQLIIQSFLLPSLPFGKQTCA